MFLLAVTAVHADPATQINRFIDVYNAWADGQDYGGYIVEPGNRARHDANTAEMLEASAVAIAALDEIPPAYGDEALRSASREAYAWTSTEVALLDRSWDILASSTATNADLASLEMTERGLMEGPARNETAVAAALENFDQRHDLWSLQLPRYDAPDLAALMQAFRAPDLVPEDSVLDAETHVIMASKYENAMFGQLDELYAAFGSYSDAAEPRPGESFGVTVERTQTAQRTTQVALERIEREVRETGDWQGDARVQGAVLDLTAAFEALLIEEVAGLVYLDEVFPWPWRVRRTYDAIDDQYATVTVEAAMMEATLDEFERRWGIDRYEAWQSRDALSLYPR
jgi:hypothetical protein